MSTPLADTALAAPVTVIIGRDIAFYEKLPALFPHTDARAWFAGNEALIEETSLRDAAKLFPRSPRLSFDEACRVV